MRETMSETGSTDRADYLFSVKEYADGTPWIMLEPRRGDLKVLKPQRSFLGFDLHPGTSLEEARKIADYFNRHVPTVTCTSSSKTERRDG
jgi:hypothetical protein